MKTKEELIKIYSAYLPYGLSVFFEENNAFYPLVINNPSVSMKGGFNINEVINEEMKPLLWSVDMLTKEIEHKGEKIKFTDYFRQKYESEIINDFAIKMWEHDFINTIMYDDYLTLPYYYIQELLKFHFNVFRLDESEYIQKHPVIQK